MVHTCICTWVDFVPAGACFSLLSAAALVVFFSLVWPQNYDWRDMKFQTFDNIDEKVC